MTAVRLAHCGPPQALARALGAPTVRLAHKVTAQGENVLAGMKGVDALPKTSAPALLVFYAYLKPFLKAKGGYVYRDWSLDSGAYTAHASGKPVDLQAFIETAKNLLATDETLTEVFALDVIGDWRASLRNTETMWKAGVPAIPCYHVGEPEDVLMALARDYPKIALGGRGGVSYAKKTAWARQCFARVWPKRVHGFGVGSKEEILALPWHSVDATNWEIGATKYGRWHAFGQLSIRGSGHNLRAEVEHYLAIERAAQARWKKEMAQLEAEAPAPSVRLATALGGGGTIKRIGAALAPRQEGPECES